MLLEVIINNIPFIKLLKMTTINNYQSVSLSSKSRLLTFIFEIN